MCWETSEANQGLMWPKGLDFCSIYSLEADRKVEEWWCYVSEAMCGKMSERKGPWAFTSFCLPRWVQWDESRILFSLLFMFLVPCNEQSSYSITFCRGSMLWLTTTAQFLRWMLPNTEISVHWVWDAGSGHGGWGHLWGDHRNPIAFI